MVVVVSVTGLCHFRLRLETLQTFDQSDEWWKDKKTNSTPLLLPLDQLKMIGFSNVCTYNATHEAIPGLCTKSLKEFGKSTAVLCDILVTSRNTPSDLNYECCCIYAASSQGFLLQRLETSFLFWTRWWLQCLQAQKRLQNISSVSQGLTESEFWAPFKDV